MANYVRNRVEIIGTEEQVKEVLMFIKGDEGAIDFNKIIPCPEALKVESSYKGIDGMIYLVKSHGGFRGFGMDGYESSEHNKMMRELMSEDPKCFEETIKLGKVYLHNIADYGFPSWYGWTWNNWGTNWNADYIEQYDNIVEFETNWCAPIPVIEHLASIFPNVEFNHKWADIDDIGSCAERKYSGGKLTFKNDPIHSSTEAYELIFDLLPFLKDYYEFVDGEYRCKDED